MSFSFNRSVIFLLCFFCLSLTLIHGQPQGQRGAADKSKAVKQMTKQELVEAFLNMQRDIEILNLKLTKKRQVLTQLDQETESLEQRFMRLKKRYLRDYE